jgi:hypothetical protein
MVLPSVFERAFAAPFRHLAGALMLQRSISP